MELPWMRGHRCLTENHDLRLWVQTPDHATNFSTQDSKKFNKVPSVRVIEICSDHRRLWRYS